MIIIPVWVEKEDSDGMLVVFGSEPKANAEPEWISRESIEKCIYSDLTSDDGAKRMAMLLVKEEKLPGKIKKILENNKS